MKKLVSILFIFSLLLSSLSSSVIYIYYLTNKNYFAQILCENKANPQMHCNGHCHLKKQLDQQQKKEQSAPVGNVKDKTEIVYFYQSPNLNIFSSSQSNINNFHAAELLTTDYPSSVFHPPSC